MPWRGLVGRVIFLGGAGDLFKRTTRVIRRKYSGERKKAKEKRSKSELEIDQLSVHWIDHNPHRSIDLST